MDLDVDTTHIWVVSPVGEEVAVYLVEETATSLLVRSLANVQVPAQLRPLFLQKEKSADVADLGSRPLTAQLTVMRHMAAIARAFPARLWEDDDEDRV
jgi:hypothetical protein